CAWRPRTASVTRFWPRASSHSSGTSFRCTRMPARGCSSASTRSAGRREGPCGSAMRTAARLSLASIPGLERHMFRSRQRGFSLLEVVVALVVVGLTLAGALGAAAADIRASRKVADAVLARIELMSATELAELGANEAGRFGAPMERYHWRADVRPVSGELDLMEVHVSISWAGGSLEVSTRLARSLDSAP